MASATTYKPWLWLGLAAWLGACAGGQTGETGGGAGERATCTKSEVEITLDQRLPAGYTARDLIEVFDGASATGYLLPSATPADDRALQPSDALAVTEIMLEFVPDDDQHVALFEGTYCMVAGFTVYGTLTATTLDGEVVLSAEGGLAGPPERAIFWSGDLKGSPGLFPNPDLYGGFASCNPDVPPLTVWMSNGVLMGNLCTSEGLLRFPTVCGGFAQVPLDEEVEPELALPSRVIERLQRASLEVAWSTTERSPFELTITPAELACYREAEYDYEGEGPSVTSTTAVTVAVVLDDARIAFEEQASLVGSSFGDDREVESRLRACTDLESVAVVAVNERLDSTFRHVHACLDIVVHHDESLEIALELSGGSTMTRDDTEPPQAIELMERLPILEVEP